MALRCHSHTSQFLFLSLVLAGTASFALSIAVLCFCDFVTRAVVLTPAGNQFCDDIEFVSPSECQIFLQNHSIGFFGFQGKLPSSDSVTCFSYNQVADDLQYESPPVDSSLFLAAKVFAIAASVFGGVTFIGLVLVFCACPGLSSRLWCLSVCYLLAAITQGLSLLVFDSSVCNLTYLEGYYAMYPNLTEQNLTQADEQLVDAVTCGWSRGSILAVAAAVLYCGCLIASLKSAPFSVETLSEIPGISFSEQSSGKLNVNS